MAGCSISERRDDQVKARGRSALHELAQTSKQFCDILCRYPSEVSSGVPVCEQLFDEFLTVTLPPGSRNPFSVFTGTPEKPVVVVSQIPPRPRQEDLTEDSSCEEPEACLNLEELILLSRSNTAAVGQWLTEKLEFLTCSQPFHQSEKSETRVSQTLHARDIGLLPVSMERARFVCSLYNIGSQKWSATLPDLWIFCRDRGNTVAIGCSQDGGGRSLVRLLEVSKAGIVHLPSGPVGAKKPPPSTCWKLKPHERSNSTAYCEYEVISADSELTPSDLVIQFAWGEVEQHLCLPPETSVAMLKVSTKPGHMGSSVLGLYREVLTLLNLCLVSSGKANWAETGGGLEASPSLASQLSAFFDATTCPLAQPKEDPTQQSTHLLFHARKNLDFVERLWLFCKDVQRIEDLQDVLATVFKAVLFRKVHPWIHQNSATTLADLFRQALLCATSDEIRALGSKMEATLSEAKILDCLVQAGIEKLRRDYHDCFFRGHSLVTDAHLDPFLRGTTALESCHNLCKLHSVLELVSCAVSYLNLPLPFLSQLTREALDVYARMDFCGFESTPVFSLPIPAHCPALRGLLALCTPLVPRVWSVTTRGLHGCQMTVYMAEPLLKHLTVDAECNDSVTDLYVYKGGCSSL